MKAIAYLYDADDQIIGVQAEDQISGEIIEIHATVVVNATGHWSDKTQSMQKGIETNRMYPSKGVHFVVDAAKLPVKRTIYTDTGLDDERMIFIVPRGGKTYFGTTDTPYDENLVEPSIVKADVDYLLKAVNYRFPEVKLTINDIETGWSGLRPLLLDEDATDASKISRSHDVFVSEKGLVTIAGGKLTDYRLMAEDTFEMIEEQLKSKIDKSYPQGDTKKLPLSGGDLPAGTTMDRYIEENLEEAIAIGLTEQDARKLIQWYGTNIKTLFILKDELNSEKLPLHLELSLLYGLEYESVMTPIDFFLRRTGILLFESDKVDQWKELVIDYMTNYFGWDDQTKAKQQNDLEEMISHITLKELRN